MELVTHQPRLILPYGMLFTRLYNHLMSNFPELSSDRYVLYDHVMYPLAPQHVRKMQKDYGMKKGRHSTSASFSFAFGHISSCHHVDDDNDKDNKDTSRVSTPSPTRYVNSLSNDVPQDNEDANEHIEKVLKIVDLFHIPELLIKLGREIKKVNERVYVAQVGCKSHGGLHYTKDFPLIEEGKTFEEAYYTQFENEVLGELMDREKSATNLKKLLMEKPRIGYQIEASINTPDLTVLDGSLPPKENYPESLGELAPTKLIIELADRTIKCPKGIAENVLIGICKFVFLIEFIVLDMPEDIKVPLILERPFLSTTYAKIDVFKRKITLRVGDDKIVFKSDNITNNIIRRVYVLGLRERIKLDLEARLIGEALILNRSLDPVYGDFIKLNDLNEPLELRRNQVEDLGPTIKEGEVIDEPMEDIVKTRNDDNEISNVINKYPVFVTLTRRSILIVYNLQFSCMIGFKHVNANFLPIFSINVISKSFNNSIIKDKVEFKEKNVARAFINVPIFIRNFSIVTDFVVMKNMDAYHDEGMGNVIVGKMFCR
nr:hypothetical protein [Tanacetum cinerariifolium]